MTSPAAAAICDRWVDAFNRADVDALVRLYTPDVLFFGSLPDLYVGHDGVRDYFNRVVHGVRAQIEDRRFTGVSAGVLAMSSSLVATPDTGDRRQYRLTWTLVENAGEWLIAHHHGSLRPQ